MPEESVELVRRAYEAWNARGPTALEPWISEYIELQDAPELPDARSWRGREAVLARLEEVAAATGGRKAEIEEVRAAGDQVLVALIWQTDTGGAVLADVFHVLRVSAGKIVSMRVFLDRSEALEAAGL